MLATEHILAQLCVIVQILVALHDGVDALANQIAQRVRDQIRVARIVKHRCGTLRELQPSIHFAHQQQATIAGDITPAEIHFQGTTLEPGESKLPSCTTCHRRILRKSDFNLLI